MKKQIAVILGVLLAVMTVFPGVRSLAAEAEPTSPGPSENTTAARIVDKEQEKAQTESELQNAEQSKQNLEQAKIQLEGYLGELNAKLQEISGNIGQLEQQISGKLQEIDTIKADLDKAKTEEKEQYEDMKKRIQYMYEKGSLGMYSMLLSGQSLSEVISRSEYIAKISKYDRDMLQKYQDTKNRIQENEDALVKQQKELSGMEGQLKAQEAELEKTVAATGENIKKHEAEIAAAELQIQNYEQQIAKQEAELSDLQAIQEAEAIASSSSEVAEAAAKAQEIASGLKDKMSQLGIQVPETVVPTYGEAYAATATDLVLMATIIYVEAGIEPFEGKCAVGACVMNRVRSPEFPNSILGVIYQPGQFTPVTTGRFALALAQGVPDECYRAAQMALDGYNNIGDYLYFRTPNGRVSGLQIGGHIFHDGHVF